MSLNDRTMSPSHPYSLKTACTCLMYVPTKYPLRILGVSASANPLEGPPSLVPYFHPLPPHIPPPDAPKSCPPLLSPITPFPPTSTLIWLTCPYPSIHIIVPPIFPTGTLIPTPSTMQFPHT